MHAALILPQTCMALLEFQQQLAKYNSESDSEMQ